MKVKPKTSIIIPTHNNGIMVRKCVEVVMAYSQDFEIIFVIDKSVNFYRELGNFGTVVYAPRPFVFAHRVNTGIRAARGEYFLILNDDTVPGSNYLTKMVASAERNGNCIVGARSQRGGCNNPDAQGKGPEKETRYTLNMFATLIPRFVYEAVGPLDERFIYYGGEDDDYSLRVLRLGFKLIVSDGYVFHKVGGAFDAHTVKVELPKTQELFRQKWGVDIPRPPKEHWLDGVRRPIVEGK